MALVDPQSAESKKPKYKKLCSGLRYDLKKCILATDCVKIEKKLPSKCIQEPNLPHECYVLAREFFECKRQFIDMRKRFRGNRGY